MMINLFFCQVKPTIETGVTVIESIKLGVISVEYSNNILAQTIKKAVGLMSGRNRPGIIIYYKLDRFFNKQIYSMPTY
jgi:hypothetical protein